MFSSCAHDGRWSFNRPKRGRSRWLCIPWQTKREGEQVPRLFGGRHRNSRDGALYGVADRRRPAPPPAIRVLCSPRLAHRRRDAASRIEFALAHGLRGIDPWRKSAGPHRDRWESGSQEASVSGRCRAGRTTLALLSVCSVLQPSIAPLLNARAEATAETATGARPQEPTAVGRAITRLPMRGDQVFQPKVAVGTDSFTWWHAAVSYRYRAPQARSAQVEADTSVALGERLVNFSHVAPISQPAERSASGSHRHHHPGSPSSPLMIALDRVSRASTRVRSVRRTSTA
jgi:hypothetical protein